MKLLLLSLLLSATAMAAETTTPATAEVTATSPKAVCEALAKAASENNFKAFAEWTVMPGMMMGAEGHSCSMMGEAKECTEKNCPMHKGHKMAKGKGPKHGMKGMPEGHDMHGMNMEDGFKKMHEKEMERLKGLNCKEEKISGDHAWVEATSQNETRLVPFKMMEGKWKFDMKTYHSFYHPPMQPEAKK